MSTTHTDRDFERWFLDYLIRHPLLASPRPVLPGLDLQALVQAAAGDAWRAAQRSVQGSGVQETPATATEAPGAAGGTAEYDRPRLVTSPTSPTSSGYTRRPRRPWTEAEREAMSERMKERWAVRKGILRDVASGKIG